MGTFARTTTVRPAGSRPACSAAWRKVVARAGTTSAEKAIGLRPSAIRPARRAPAGVVAPSSTGRRSWTGLGLTSEGAMRWKRPSYSTGSGPQQARMAATTSSMPAPIRSMGTFAVSNSWGIQP